MDELTYDIRDSIMLAGDIRFLLELVNKLSERRRKILLYRFMTPATLERTGKQFGITRERVRQQEAKALRDLRLLWLTNDKIFKDIELKERKS